VSSGFQYNCGITTAGELLCWGCNEIYASSGKCEPPEIVGVSPDGEPFSIGDACEEAGVIDCSAACVSDTTASSWVGDGSCDDGTWGLDLYCEAFDWDEGDCDSDVPDADADEDPEPDDGTPDDGTSDSSEDADGASDDDPPDDGTSDGTEDTDEAVEITASALAGTITYRRLSDGDVVCSRTYSTAGTAYTGTCTDCTFAFDMTSEEISSEGVCSPAGWLTFTPTSIFGENRVDNFVLGHRLSGFDAFGFDPVDGFYGSVHGTWFEYAYHYAHASSYDYVPGFGYYDAVFVDFDRYFHHITGSTGVIWEDTMFSSLRAVIAHGGEGSSGEFSITSSHIDWSLNLDEAHVWSGIYQIEVTGSFDLIE
jgi:hypothetical protein